MDRCHEETRTKKTDLTVISTGIHRVFSGIVQMQFINLLCFVYLVAGTTLKDQIDIKVSPFLRNVCEEEHAEEHTQVVDSCDTQEARNYETPEANVYEFHSSGVIDMLEKLQKELDAEWHDAQEDESNAAHASSMKAQDLTDAVANGQTGVSHSKGIISPTETGCNHINGGPRCEQQECVHRYEQPEEH